MRERPPHRLLPTGAATRRYLTVLFSDLSDSSRIAEHVEAEDFAELLAHIRNIAESTIARHGGTIVQVQGDGILACFGYPIAREDDGRRATEAALELHERVRELRLTGTAMAERLTMHSGIHAGLVLVERGDRLRGRLVLLGNDVNIASRLSDRAEADQILVSAATLGAESTFYEALHRRSGALQGIAEQIDVLDILGRAPVARRFEARAKRGLTPLVGREAELDWLEAKLAESRRGSLRFVALTAPAGLGKTRLAEEFLDRAEIGGCSVHRGYCESYLAAEPLQPFLQIIRAVCGLTFAMPANEGPAALQRALAGILPESTIDQDLLGAALSYPTADRRAAQDITPSLDSMIQAFSRILDALAMRSPLVLFFDDWQWADDASRQVLDALLRLRDRPILLVVATRGSGHGEFGLSEAEILRLRPLTEGEAREAIGMLIPDATRFVVSKVCDSAGGNPLFLEELAHAAGHDQWRLGAGRRRANEAWLSQIIAARVERLTREQRDIVRLASVIGNVIPARILECLTGCDENHPSLEDLARHDLVYRGERPGTFRFKHGIAREVIYDAVGLYERRAIHLRVAQALTDHTSAGAESEHYEALAYHYGAGGSFEEAARFAELAGDKANAASALDRAQVQYSAALAALDQMDASPQVYERWMAIVQRLAVVCVFDPSRDQLRLLVRATKRAAAEGDAKSLCGMHFWLGYVYYALGESRLAIAELEEAEAIAERLGLEPFRTRIHATMGQACAAACDYARADNFLNQAIETKRAGGHWTRPAVGYAYTLACKASVEGDRGRFADAHGLFDEALSAVEGTSHEVEGSIRCWWSGVLLWQGRWDEARSTALEAQGVAERVGSHYLYAMSVALGAYATWNADRSSDHLQKVIDSTSWLLSGERHLFVSLNCGWLAEGTAFHGRRAEARSYAARTIRRIRARDLLGGAMAYRSLARLTATNGGGMDPDRYLRLAMANAMARQSPHEVANTLLCRAELYADRDRTDAAKLVDRAEGIYESLQMPWHLQAVRSLRDRLPRR